MQKIWRRLIFYILPATRYQLCPPGYELRFSRIIDVGDTVWSNPASLCERAGEFLVIVLEIGGRDCKNKNFEIYIVMIFFDSWCRTI